MKKAPLYSRSRRPAGAPAEPVPISPPAEISPSTARHSTPRFGRWRAAARRHARPLWAVFAAALVLLGAAGQRALSPPPTPLSQLDFDTAVRRSIEKEPLPSAYARAYEAVRPSVVRVVGLGGDANEDSAKVSDDPKAHTRSTGTGVVIIDNGTILTNLHVVIGAKRIKVTFFDGHESEASMVGAQPENDLAVLRAKSVPDDLVAATMRGTGDLLPGDEVVAIGFPFGIGPSASGGVVSGLRRQFRSPEGERLTNLIQFDAAANPGNSGGPLVTMDGSVVGIVTAILNPGEQGTFIGIGFAVPIENAAAAAGMPPF
jgi:S1-C subfamily serine protease